MDFFDDDPVDLSFLEGEPTTSGNNSQNKVREFFKGLFLVMLAFLIGLVIFENTIGI